MKKCAVVSPFYRQLLFFNLENALMAPCKTFVTVEIIVCVATTCIAGLCLRELVCE